MLLTDEQTNQQWWKHYIGHWRGNNKASTNMGSEIESVMEKGVQ